MYIFVDRYAYIMYIYNIILLINIINNNFYNFKITHINIHVIQILYKCYILQFRCGDINSHPAGPQEVDRIIDHQIWCVSYDYKNNIFNK